VRFTETVVLFAEADWEQGYLKEETGKANMAIRPMVGI
jgi:hypothetical protein